MRRELERIEIPGEHEARERTWSVVRAAHAQREPRRSERRLVRPLLGACALGAVVAAAASPPGRAVIDSVREAVGVDGADEALFAVPGGERLLVAADGGTWVVAGDGSKRLLAGYRDASWSPFGRFIVAVRGDELVALEPDGDVRWKLARRSVSAPSWTGSRTDTRIAYVGAGRLRLVGGDGRGDRTVAPARAVRPAWRPGSTHVLAYADGRGRIVLVDVSAGARRLWRTPTGGHVDEIRWSSDGRRLLVVRGGRVEVLTRDGAPFTGIRLARGSVTSAAFRPGSHAVAYAADLGGRSQVVLVDEPSRVLFSGPGRFTDLEWSPRGDWLLAGWSDADQWLFLRGAGAGLRAVSGVRSQFDSSSFPRVQGWCCS